MPKKNKAIVPVRAEILPPLPRQVPDAWAEIERFIEQKLAEMTSGHHNTVFEPWFRSKLVADAIRRSQTVIEQQKWPLYFAKWGCLICGVRDAAHLGRGMCQVCYTRTEKRLQQIIKEAEAEQKQQNIPSDLADKAQAALRRKR